ncbi:MAG: NADH-quinone oxidoreductase subunit NuoE [Spirochaetota bacterium]|nr:MAG: NADH-quinone oxidoreductase subunit NuoE [Spirochaetota bacterium]
MEPALTIIESENVKPGSLITILQKIQTQYGYLPKKILEIISRRIDIPAAKVLGAASFYSQFKFEESGKNVIKVCHGTACHISGASKILGFLEDHLKITDGETTDDKLFTIERVACLGCCSLAPVMMINDTTYGRLTLDKLRKVINHYRKEGQSNA